MLRSFDCSHRVDQLDPHSGSETSRDGLHDELAATKLKLSGKRRSILRSGDLWAASHGEVRPRRRRDRGESPPTRSAVSDRDGRSRSLRRNNCGDLFAAERLPQRLATVRANRTTDRARTGIARHNDECPRCGRPASSVSVAPRKTQHSSDARFGTRLRASVSVGPARSRVVPSERVADGTKVPAFGEYQVPARSRKADRSALMPRLRVGWVRSGGRPRGARARCP
jgi:hypothetical protein